METAHPVGSSWAAQAQKTAHLLETQGAPQQDVTAGWRYLLFWQPEQLSRQRSPKVVMFHWLACLSDTAETEASEDGELEVGLLILVSGR